MIILAAPSVTNARVLQLSGYPFQPRQFQVNLDQTIANSYYYTRTGAYEDKSLPMPGELRYECAIPGRGPFKNIFAVGSCIFKWVYNATGATLEQYSKLSRPPSVGATAMYKVTGGTVSTIIGTDNADAAFTAHTLEHTIAMIYDDVGGANAAPEGEARYVIHNDTTTLTVQPDFTVAPANGDTFDVFFPHHVEDAVDGDQALTGQGVVVASDGLATVTWGWSCVWGYVMVAAANAVARDLAVVAANTAAVGASGADAVDLHSGWSPFTTQAANGSALVFINDLYPPYNSAA